MNCFPCFPSWLSNCRNKVRFDSPAPNTQDGNDVNARQEGHDNVGNSNINAHAFTFHELATATKNFRQECLLGNGGFGRVYKGTLQSVDQVVAVKQLDRNGNQGNKEFLVEVLMLSLLHHPNLLNFIGYCAHGEQRLLVHEYMPQGSLEYHLHDLKEEGKAMEWFIRMKIAVGAARGLEHLHVKANPPVIYRDLKSSNILLDSDFNPKLSDFGLVDLGTTGDQKHMSSRVMGTYGYCAPEYARTGKLTLHSDIYSFGVVMLELITGRRALDTTRLIDDQNLVSWAQPMFRDPRRFHELVDPLLKSNFPERGLNQAVAIAAMCLQEEACARPLITDVVTALSFLSVPPTSESDMEMGSPAGVMGEEHHYEKKKQGRRPGDEQAVYGRSESRRRWAEKVQSASSRKSESRSSSLSSSSSTSIEEVQSEAVFVSGEL